MKYIVNSTAYYAVSETKPETPTQYPPDESVWSNLPPDADENVWSTRATSYSDGTFEYSEVIVNGGDTTPSVAPNTKTYYKVLPVGSEAPAKPTDNPPSGWEGEEPEYDTQEYDEYSIIVYTYDDGTFTVSEPQLEYKPEDDEPAYEEPETFFYYIVVANGAVEPDVPTTNPPPSPWVDTEPEYEYVSQDLYSVSVSVYSDGTFEYDNVQKETAPEEKTLELAAGNGVYYSESEPTGGEYNDGDVWFCTATEGNNAGGIFIYHANEDGTGSWIAHQVGTVSVKDGSITADKIVVNDVFARLVLSKDIVATGKITATNLNITGDSTFSGSLNGATGTFSGVLSAQDIDITSSYTSEDALGNYTNTIKTVDGVDPEKGGYKYIQLYSSMPGGRGSSGLRVTPLGIVLTGNVSIESNGYQDGDLDVAGKIKADGCTICNINTIGGSFVYGGGVALDTSSNGQTWSAAHPSYVGSIKDNGSWYNYISVRHQNGYDDGNKYGMRFWSPLHSRGDLRWQQQVGSWGTAKVIIDNSNISTYLPTGAPGTKGGAQFASGGIKVGSVPAGDCIDYPHTFSKAFGGTPNVVVCTYESSAGTSASGNVARKVILTKRSSTGFTVRLYNNSSSTWSPYVEYIAIYKG